MVRRTCTKKALHNHLNRKGALDLELSQGPALLRQSVSDTWRPLANQAATSAVLSRFSCYRL